MPDKVAALIQKKRTRREFLRGAGIALGAAGMSGVLSACGGSGGSGGGGGSGEPLRVAFVYIGPPGDAGWTKRHDDGRKDLEKALGNKVETTFVENVPEGATAQRVFEDLARKGNKLIFGTSFGYMDSMVAAAKKYPDTTFEHATGFKTAENLGTYAGAAEQATYLSGMAAGAAAKNNKIGYLMPFPIPEVIRGMNAHHLGAQAVNPDVTTQLVWTSTWYGPDTEKQAAESLVNAGVDVLGMQQDSPATGQVAEAEGVKWTGFNDDMERFAPNAWLTGLKWNWGPYYTNTAQQVLDGKWKSDEYYGTMADGIVGLAPYGKSVSEETKKRIEERQQAIIDGEFEPFTGPVRDQEGNVRIPEGETATLEELLSMDYLVEGVIGKVPKG
ncbi:MAG: BMP family ABC transporter substrate-binding protein [Actinomycetota bacterium]|nr:BMP family ABC transporter substrate-binding protein [Actinomycetota bacterium]